MFAPCVSMHNNILMMLEMLVYKPSPLSSVCPPRHALLLLPLVPHVSPSSPSHSYIRTSAHASCLICLPSSTLLPDLLFCLISHPSRINSRDVCLPRPAYPSPTHLIMPANVLLATRSSLHANSPSSGYPHSEWQHYPPSQTWVRCDLPPPHRTSPVLTLFFSHQTSGSGSPTPMHTDFSPNQASVWTLFGLGPVTDVHS
jgi:hypothetical protein